MGRSPCCSKVGLKRGPWSIEEDNLLTNYIHQNGEGQWRSLPKNAGLLRCGKSCRLRWMNYLRPGIVRGNITQDEEDLIVRLHGLLGNRWSLIAGRLPGRTDNEVKNYWNTHLLKKLNEAGVNPKPRSNLPKKTKKTAAVDGGGKGKGRGKNKNKKKKNKQNENETKDNTDNNNVALSSSKNSINGSASVEEKVDSTPRTKVYLPKPIRVSSVFSRTSSYESLGSRTMSSSDGGGAEKAAEVAWPPKFEVGEEDGYFAACGGGDDDFLGCGDGYNNMGLMIGSHHLDSMPSDVIMWEQVYDEYLQLL